MSWLDLMRIPDNVSIECDSNWRRMRRSAALWVVDDSRIETRQQGETIAVLVTAEHRAVSRVHLRWDLNVPQQLRVSGDHWERGYGDLEWRGIVPERVLPWYFLAFDGAVTHGCGVRTGAAALCFWTIDEEGVSLWLDIRNGGRGVELAGRTLHAADLTIRLGHKDESAFAAARDFCRQLCASSCLPDHPVYGGNNWYYSYGKSSHREILINAELMAELAPAGENRPYMVIDAGWQARSLSEGHICGSPWNRGNANFPDMPGLAADIRGLGVRPGLWLRPLAAGADDPASMLLSDERTSVTVKDRILDPSIPDVLDRVFHDFRCVSEWGYHLIKHDYTTYDIMGRWGFEMGAALTNNGWCFADRSLTTAEIITNLYRRMREGAADALLIGCNTMNHLSSGFFELQRIGDDTSGLIWERTRKMGVNSLAFRLPQHGVFFAADPDCVGLTNDIPWELNRQWLELVSMSGTPLFVSAAPGAVGEPQKIALRKAFALAARNSVPAEPMDWMDTTCPRSWTSNGTARQFSWFSPMGVIF